VTVRSAEENLKLVKPLRGILKHKA